MFDRRWIAVAWLLAVSGAGLAVASQPSVLSLHGSLGHDVVPAGGDSELRITVALNGSWHINAEKPADPNLIPTQLTIEPVAGVSFGSPKFPEPSAHEFEFAPGETLLVYEGTFGVRVPITVAADAAIGEHPVRAKLRYQACDNERCLAPKTESVTVSLHIAEAGAVATAVADSGASGAAATDAALVTTEPAKADADDSSGGLLSAERVKNVFDRGYLLGFSAIFLLGLALNLTPCVYPVIPITLGYFAHQSEKRDGKTLSLAVVYVLGMALMYSSLGVFAALTGKAFGTALQSSWVLVFEAIVMIALAASMFGAFEITVPSSIANKLGASPSGHAGALFMGLTVGIVAAPCLAPAVLGLFVLVAQLKSVPFGFAIFFVLALGLGFPFLLLGTASGAMSKLPRSGEWMIWIKRLFGFMLIGMAIYFLRPVVGNALFTWGIPILALVAGVFLGFLDKTGSGVVSFTRVKTVVGVLLLVASVAGFVGFNRPAGAAEDGIVWQDYDPATLAAALEAGTPVMIDFTAEWCAPCKELDLLTFVDPAVVREAGRFKALKADGTHADDEVDALMKRFEVVGFPTVLFLDSKGDEARNERVVGFVKADAFLGKLQKVQ